MKLLTLALCASAAFAADYMPLQPGNFWNYRDASSGQVFTIRVGAPLPAVDGHVYHRLSGYVAQDVWARAIEDGTLVYLDEETGAERVLTSFKKSEGNWAAAPLRGCEHESLSDGKASEFKGRAGSFTAAVTLNYRVLGCADSGAKAEIYAPGIGMVSRTVHSMAGPRVMELVEARVGAFTFIAAPAASFSASLAEGANGILGANLRLSVAPGESLDLMYSSSQDYNLVVWDETGKRVYRWSDGKAFAQAARWITVTGRRAHDVVIDTPAPLADGRYILEAWITAGPSGRAFAAMTAFTIADGKLVK